ncbi:MAG: polyprenyl synthetase family protein [Anaerolineales bacterium]|nr:polyprenyl synthetase family protein [Anaerolineales bacterium]
MNDLIQDMRTAIEKELQKQAARLDSPHSAPFHEMLTYHLGWTGTGAGPQATGKRIRPTLTLLCAAACGADWEPVLPAAAAIELVHNFSLVHDDIQDNSDMRRGRLTVWKIWGQPMAINVGDTLFSMANQAILDLAGAFPADHVIDAARTLHDTCLELTRGQFMDMSFEERTDVRLEEYWLMITGKTAALLSCCCSIGALLGGADEAARDAYRAFGHYLGLAFQAQDDILGIWGDEAQTGKSAASDLVEGKKSLPILYGLKQDGAFKKRWQAGPVKAEEVPGLAAQLAREGAHEYTQKAADQLTEQAQQSLRLAAPQGAAGDYLEKLASKLLRRET